MARLLLRVEDAMMVKTGRLMLAPHLPLEEARKGPTWVEMRFKDRLERVQALVLPGSANAKDKTRQVFAAVILVGVKREDVPRGTEIWLLD